MNLIFSFLLGLSFLCWVISWFLFFQRKNNLVITVYILSIASSILQFLFLIFFSFNEDWSDSSRLLLIFAFLINGLFIFLIRKKDAFYWGIVLPGFVFFFSLVFSNSNQAKSFNRLAGNSLFSMVNETLTSEVAIRSITIWYFLKILKSLPIKP